MTSEHEKTISMAGVAGQTDKEGSLARIQDLIARSSLGSSGAVELRDRTSPEMSALVRQLADLRNRMAHSHTGEPMTLQDIPALLWVAEQSEQLGLHDTARWALSELAAVTLERLARSFEADGRRDAAQTWRARARTVHL